MHPMFVGFRTWDGKKKTDGTNQSAIEMTERPSTVKTEKSFLVKLSFMRPWCSGLTSVTASHWSPVRARLDALKFGSICQWLDEQTLNLWIPVRLGIGPLIPSLTQLVRVIAS